MRGSFGWGRILPGHGAEGLVADGGRTVGVRDGVVDHLRGRAVSRNGYQGAVHHLARGQGAGVIVAVGQGGGPGTTGFIEDEFAAGSREFRRTWKTALRASASGLVKTP